MLIDYCSACFNTQPPEGGWDGNDTFFISLDRFNTQPPEGGWVRADKSAEKAQGFNTQPPEGGSRLNTSLAAVPDGFQHTAA